MIWHKAVLLILIPYMLSANDDKDLIDLANKIFPGHNIEIKEYVFSDLPGLFDELEKKQNIGKSLEKQIEQAELKIRELQKSYVPLFKFGSSHQSVDIKERFVSIYTRVPVEWDNVNPEQIDITLPNGGHGLLWLPMPTEYDWRYVDIHASRSYEGNSLNFNTGFQYNYHSGISLELLSVNLNKRFSPETYGFSWYSSLDNSVTIPILKIFNSDLSPMETEIAGIRKMQENLKISLKLNRILQRNRLQSMFLELYLSWERNDFYSNMISIIENQMKQINKLSEEKNITITEKISVENELQNYISLVKMESYKILRLSYAFIKDDGSVTIYKPSRVELDKKIEQLEKEAEVYTDLKNIDKIITNNPNLKILENNLNNSRSRIRMTSKLNFVQLDLIGSVSSFTSSDLGYKNPEEAVKKVFIDPDGLNTSVGIQFSIPLSFKDSEFQYQSAVKDYQILYEEFLASKEEFISNYHDLRISLLSKRENLSAAKSSYDFAHKNYLMKEEFFNLKRVSEFEFESYLKEEVKAKINLKTAKIDYYTALENLLAFISINIVEEITDSEKGGK
ncbi:MAG: TolC family protein [Candidatus Delongbacteria bacterium]|jgi:hypothetical protein|nr:TolC family protein [Candidatus Delongbacteria bacterium]